jgi:predicted lipoprotein with Yx(FWY)xxD motif
VNDSTGRTHAPPHHRLARDIAKQASGVKASLLGTIKRGDGTTQVTYNHHPLYYYSGDSGPGQQNGQGLNAFGAKWFVVGPAGSKVG